jgi:hypothetical protein
MKRLLYLRERSIHVLALAMAYGRVAGGRPPERKRPAPRRTRQMRLELEVGK